MVRTTVVGSWPVDERFREPIKRYHRGELPDDEAKSLLREVASVAIDQQVRCGFDEYTGGETSVDHFILRQEIRQFVDAGAEDVQLDAPHIAMGLADGWCELEQAVETIRALFEGVEGVRRSLHLCYGDFEARSWVHNRRLRPLLPLIQSLEGSVDRVLLELSLPEQWAERELLRQIPKSIEVAAGIVDVKSPRVEREGELRAQVEELLEYVPEHRLLICPSCGLGRRDVGLAIAKATAMVRAAGSVGAEGEAPLPKGEVDDDTRASEVKGTIS